MRPLLALILVAAGCTSPPIGTTPTPTPVATPTPAPTVAPTTEAALGERATVRVVGRRPHDPTAFTQGLEFDGGRLFESRGLYGQSAITEIDTQTGEVLRRSDLAPEFFAEGATVVDGRLLQLTWQEHTAFVYDPATLEVTGQHEYTTEGWGVCDLDGELAMSDGTPTLTFRDPLTFEPLRTVTVTRAGAPVALLNELECADGRVWANVWQSDELVVIDPADGAVLTTIDASGLLTDTEARTADVLNGIAHDPATGAWLLTGKLWPWMFEVAFDG